MSTAIHRSVLFNWFGLGVKILVGFLLLPYVVGKLGATGYGQYLFIVALFGYSDIFDFGLRAAVLRYVAQFTARGETERMNATLGTVFGYYLIIAACVLVLGLLAWLFPQPWLVPEGASSRFTLYILIFAGAAASLFFRLGWQSVLWARERYDISNVAELFAFMVRVTFLVVFLSRGYGVITLVLADLLENVLSFLIHRAIIARKFPEIRPRWFSGRHDDVRALANYSVWVFLNGVSAQLRFRAPNLVIGWVLTAADVALFGVAARIQSYLFQISTAMNAPFRTRMSALEGTNDWDALRDLFLRATQLITMLAVTSTGILFVFGDRFLQAWVGEELGEGIAQSIRVLQILLPALAAEMSQLAATSALYAAARHQWLSGIILGEALAILGLGIFLTLKYGVVGAALGTAIPILANKLFLQSLFSCRKLGVPYAQYLRRGILGPVMSGVLTIPLLYGLKVIWKQDNLIAVFTQMGLSLIPFAVCAWFLALDPRDRQRLHEILGGLVRR